MDLSIVREYAQAAAKSGLCAVKSPEAAFVIIATGMELGLSPMQSLRGIHIINSKPVLSADLIVAVCKRSPLCRSFRLVESSTERAIYETLREGDAEPTRLTWTIEDAERAGLTRNALWRAHTAAMLRARCGAALARAVYPDLVLGLYEDDEGREIEQRERPEVLPAVPPSRALAAYQAAPAPTLEDGTQRAALEAALASAETLADLARAGASVAQAVKAGAISQHEREALQAVYRLRKEELDVRAITETAAPVMEVFPGAEVVSGE